MHIVDYTPAYHTLDHLKLSNAEIIIRFDVSVCLVFRFLNFQPEHARFSRETDGGGGFSVRLLCLWHGIEVELGGRREIEVASRYNSQQAFLAAEMLKQSISHRRRQCVLRESNRPGQTLGRLCPICEGVSSEQPPKKRRNRVCGMHSRPDSNGIPRCSVRRK